MGSKIKTKELIDLQVGDVITFDILLAIRTSSRLNKELAGLQAEKKTMRLENRDIHHSYNRLRKKLRTMGKYCEFLEDKIGKQKENKALM